jgi:Flp pilus assembly protein TadG
MGLLHRRVRAHRHVHARPRWSESGAAAVETALCLVFIVVPLVLGIIEFGAMLSFRQALSQAASEGARAAVGAPSTAAAQSAAQTAINNALANYSSAGIQCGSELTCSYPAPPSSCPSGHTCITVQVSTDYRDNPKFISFPGLDFALPNTLSFTSTVEVS